MHICTSSDAAEAARKKRQDTHSINTGRESSQQYSESGKREREMGRVVQERTQRRKRCEASEQDVPPGAHSVVASQTQQHTQDTHTAAAHSQQCDSGSACGSADRDVAEAQPRRWMRSDDGSVWRVQGLHVVSTAARGNALDVCSPPCPEWMPTGLVTR